jgi:branched-chain amino acid aminotransferase
VLFLDARNDKYVEEAGASNFFCLSKDGVLRTPELGAILPGVTRMSLMQLVKDMGIKVILIILMRVSR